MICDGMSSDLFSHYIKHQILIIEVCCFKSPGPQNLLSLADYYQIMFLWGKLMLRWTLHIFSSSIRKELRTKEVNHDTLIQLGHPIQLSKLNPTRAAELSWRPRSGTTMNILLSVVDNAVHLKSIFIHYC